MKWHNSRQDWFDRADRELHNARKKARYRENPEALAAKAAAWRAAHPEQQKRYERKRREKHPEAVKQQNARWRAENIEYVRAKARLWHEKNREKANAGRIERYRETKEFSPWARSLASRATKAMNKKLPFELDAEWAQARWTGRCELSQMPFCLTNRYGDFFSPSIDKIDPKKGYTKDNCRFILFALNAFKGTGTDEDMWRVINALCAVRHDQEPPLKL